MGKIYSVQLIKEVLKEALAGADVVLTSGGKPIHADSLEDALHYLLRRSPEYCQHFEQTWQQLSFEQTWQQVSGEA